MSGSYLSVTVGSANTKAQLYSHITVLKHTHTHWKKKSSGCFSLRV